MRIECKSGELQGRIAEEWDVWRRLEAMEWWSAESCVFVGVGPAIPVAMAFSPECARRIVAEHNATRGFTTAMLEQPNIDLVTVDRNLHETP